MRRFPLSLAVFAGLAAVFYTSGCGGLGGSGTTGGTTTGGTTTGGGTFALKQTTVPGMLDLPSAVPGAKFKVASSIGSEVVSSGGAIQTKIYNDGPQMVIVVDANDKVLLPAVVSKAHPNVTARSMAVAMAHYGAGLYAMVSEFRAGPMDELFDSPLIDTLEASIAAGLAAGESEETLMTRIKPDIEAFASNFHSRGVAVQPEYLSGVEIQPGDGNDVFVTNHYRRRAHLFIDRVSYKTEDGTVVPDPHEAVSQELAPVSGYNGFVSTVMAALLTGDYAYSPVRTGPYALPMSEAEGATVTKYKATLLGIGSSPGVLSEVPGERQNTYDSLALRSMILDWLFPAIFNVILPAKASPEAFEAYMTKSQGLNNLMTSMATQLGTVVPAIRDGDYKGAFNSAVSGVWDNPTLRSAVFLAVAEFITATGGQAAGEEYLAYAGRVFAVMSAVDIAAGAIDVIIQLVNAANSKQAEFYDIDITKMKAKSKVSKPVIVAGDVNVSGIDSSLVELVWIDKPTPGTDVSYEFKSLYGKVNMLNGQSVQTLENDTVMTVFPVNAETEGKDTILITARNASTTAILAQVQANVEVIKQRPIIVPNVTSLKTGETRLFHVDFMPDMPAGEGNYKYIWTVEGSGKLESNQGFLTTVDRVIYKAQASTGTDTLKLEVFKSVEGKSVKVGETTATIRLEERKSIIHGSYSTEVLIEGDYFGMHAVVKIPKQEGAKSYTLRAFGGYDYAYYRYGPIVRTDFLTGTYPQLNMVIPQDQLWMGLSAGSAHVSFMSATQGWLDGRFNNGWDWTVEVTY